MNDDKESTIKAPIDNVRNDPFIKIITDSVPVVLFRHS